MCVMILSSSEREGLRTSNLVHRRSMKTRITDKCDLQGPGLPGDLTWVRVFDATYVANVKPFNRCQQMSPRARHSLLQVASLQFSLGDLCRKIITGECIAALYSH